MSVIAYAVPVFFALIGVELLAAHRKRAPVYRFSDTVSDLSCGVISQLAGVVIALGTVAVYVGIHTHWAVFTIPLDAWWAWLLCWVLVDFCYYWFHRTSHRVNFMWAAHVVHHQSEEYNLSVALRQSALQPGYSWLFYLPLAFIGFPPVMFYSLSAANTLYQFWIHTPLIGRMGPLEWILNTPSQSIYAANPMDIPAKTSAGRPGWPWIIVRSSTNPPSPRGTCSLGLPWSKPSNGFESAGTRA